ncbi:uncharacterized protein PV06_05214 [Exophiala oligosperma]|uniref:MaoC-like domain-containing protein n=1 Tax=Exophiala oligosperma TaxID=215243 RepID=A0A0D2E8J0_9EURO|nr:uncharacterized protein PV06_05214 [Exophiala oligosperma]KIW44184.1 hypothetical protein PV06_05214 [Exophiala oligosperma]
MYKAFGGHPCIPFRACRLRVRCIRANSYTYTKPPADRAEAKHDGPTFEGEAAAPPEPDPFDHLRGRKLKTRDGPWNASNMHMLYRALCDHLNVSPGMPKRVLPGFQQVSGNDVIPEGLLCDDGADARYSPGPDWRFRLWAGGQMAFNVPWTRLDVGGPVLPNELVLGTRTIGDLDSGHPKVKVTIGRTYFSDLHGGSFPSVVEKKYLFFMRSIPPSLRSADIQRRLQPPAHPFHAETMVPSPALLFRFSALTMNDHKIHLDPEYTRRVYGIPKLLVQGPLTAVLMLEVLRKALDNYRRQQTGLGERSFVVTFFNYKNLMPLFVDEKITIACRKNDGRGPTGSRDSNPTESWRVWIQKGEGDNATVAVKGEAIVSLD